MIDKKRVASRFSLGARHYDQNTRVQKIMTRRTIQLCPKDCELPAGGVLDIGCGTGALTSALSALYPGRGLTALDIAPGMIEAAIQCQPSYITFRCADAETEPLDGPYALIASSAAFQWIDNLPAFIRKLYHNLIPGGFLAFSTFGPETFLALRSAFRKAAFLANRPDCHYSGLDYTDAPGICGFLEDIFGKDAVTWDRHLETFYYPDTRSFLRAVSRVGASGPQGQAAPPAVIRNLKDIYERENQTPYGVASVYETLYFTAHKREES